MEYIVYGKANCNFCTKAKALLEEKGLEYQYKDIEGDDVGNLNDMHCGVRQATGYPARTVPQIFRSFPPEESFQYVGGYDDLYQSLKPQEKLQDTDFDFFD